MFVLCPHCQFLVTVDAASGLPPARCPRCDGALATPEAAAPIPAPAEASPMPADAAPEAEPEAATPIDAPAPDSIADLTARPPDSFAPAAAPAVSEVTGPADDASAPAAPEARKPAPRLAVTGRKHRSAALPILALSVLLMLQLVLAERAQLASSAQWRPALAVLCGALRCALPPWREPAAITFVERDVAPDPRRPGVLHVTARFRNDARWTQAWPRLSLSLSDADGRVAGERVFAPDEYLGHRPTEKGLASGQIVAMRMDVVEPAPDIVAFTFDFR